MPIPFRTVAVLLVYVVAAGCATTDVASRDASAENTRSTASPVSAFFARFGVGPTAIDDSSMYPGTGGARPEPDPDRRISEQDCSRPVVADGGNLRCK